MRSSVPGASLLDLGALPVAELARLAMREGVRPRDVYQAHKWFARRFAVSTRALLVAATADRSESFWRKYYTGDACAARTVLDPFVGGGVVLLEAARLGADVRGVDVEPVAAAIARFQTTLRRMPDLDGRLAELQESVGSELAVYYNARDEEGHAETLLHAFWVQTVYCEPCELSYDAHPRYRLAWNREEGRQWVVCGGCGTVHEVDLEVGEVRCACGERTACGGGRVERGEFRCPGCGRQEPLIRYARRTGQRPRFRLFAVETLPTGDGERARVRVRDRRLRAATSFDVECYHSAERRLQNLCSGRMGPLPCWGIPEKGRADNRLIDYGYRDYGELFNARQRLHLAMLGAAIDGVEDESREGLAIAFSDHLTTNNMMCSYAGGWRRLAPLFAIRAYRHIARPVEINPWLRHNGRGTFPNAVRAVKRAATAAREPKEPSPNGLFKRTRDRFSGTSEVVCGDARRMKHIASGSVDLVLTDPPYFDYIPYSELGHFFAGWLGFFGLVDGRAGKGFPKGQIAAAGRSGESQRRFARRLTAAFREIRRVCKADGRVVFTYENLDGRGWSAVGSALAKVGLTPIRALPLYGNSKAGLHRHGRSVSWDAVLVCRMGEQRPRLAVSRKDRAVGQRMASAWSRVLSGRQLAMSAGDVANMREAIAIVAAFRRTSRSRSRHGHGPGRVGTTV